MNKVTISVSIPVDIKRDIIRRAKKAKTTISAYVLHAVELEKKFN